MKSMSRLALGLMLLCVLLVPRNIFSSGSWVEATFVLKHQPDAPMKAFDGGRLGILWPKFDRRYLVIAYRYLEQKPLTAQERHSLGDDAAPQVLPLNVPYDADPPLTAWLKTRSHVLGLQEVQKIDTRRYRINGFAEYPNCGDNAFTNASATATNRAQTFGIASAAIKEWVAGQDAVFQNCAAGLRYYGPDEKRPPASLYLPPPATLDNALLKFDRQYQVAAANFYAGNVDTAASNFEQIAGEPDSPWHKLAPYLVARCYIRKATLGVKDENTFLPEPMQAAEQRLQAILADKSMANMHPAAQSLLNYVEARLHPEQRLHAIAQTLASGAGQNFDRDLFDYTFLLDHLLWNAELKQAMEAHPGEAVDTSKLREDLPVNQWRADANKSHSFDDLTDWVLAFQLDDAQTRQYRFERWQATKSTPWLLSALVATRAGDPHAAEVERAAATIGADSPAYDTALYHRVRLLQQQDKNDQARKLLDANWARIEKDSFSNRNTFLAQRFAVATSFQEFLRFAPRTLLQIDYGDYYCLHGRCRTYSGAQVEPPQELDLDSVGIFNQVLPLSMLVQAANGATLPTSLRDQLAVRTWLRAAILDDTAAARELEPHLLAKFPQVRSYIEQYDRADSAQARRFALVFMVMRFPGMEAFVNAMGMGEAISKGTSNAISSGSWWCYDVGADQQHSSYQSVLWSDASGTQSKAGVALPPAPLWLAPAEKERGEREWRKLSQIGAAPMYFAPTVLDWAKAHPDDPRVPEALHYFVRATRYGCVDKSIGPYSREAFNLLHRKYPKSEWTKKTPYWFG
ncbi:MAG: hypothetical protein P4M04_00140 [Acidobacteriota bacterium]|nr:hypothetical protein [Acidobacteriota bacterium]